MSRKPVITELIDADGLRARQFHRQRIRHHVEVMWLLAHLAPDHKTIADFRRDNGPGIKKVCAQFVDISPPEP